jgi:uncharacterized membrane protein
MNKISLARGLSLASYFGLIVFAMAWAISLSGTPENRISILLLLFVTPLLIPLRGILYGREKTLVWGSLISLIYLVHGGTQWWGDGVLFSWGALELTLALLYILSSSYFIRWRATAAK